MARYARCALLLGMLLFTLRASAQVDCFEHPKDCPCIMDTDGSGCMEYPPDEIPTDEVVCDEGQIREWVDFKTAWTCRGPVYSSSQASLLYGGHANDNVAERPDGPGAFGNRCCVGYADFICRGGFWDYKDASKNTCGCTRGTCSTLGPIPPP